MGKVAFDMIASSALDNRPQISAALVDCGNIGPLIREGTLTCYQGTVGVVGAGVRYGWQEDSSDRGWVVDENGREADRHRLIR